MSSKPKLKVCQRCGKSYQTMNAGKQKYCSRACSAEVMKKRVVRQCETCGKEMEVEVGLIHRKRYCSKECFNKGQTMQVVSTCAHCGRDFEVKFRKTKIRKYCSNQCQSAALTQRKSKTIQCTTCGKEFREPISRTDRAYCSRKCLTDSQRKDEIHITRTCKVCGKDYQTTIHQVRKRGSNYCSRECAHTGKRTGTTAKSYFWRKIVKLVRQRDNHTCQLCGTVQVKPGLHVHHIIPDRLFTPDEWEAANDFGNLISLCATCHRYAESDPEVNALCQAMRQPRQLQLPF